MGILTPLHNSEEYRAIGMSQLVVSVFAEVKPSAILVTCPSCEELMEACPPETNPGFELHILKCKKCGHLSSRIVPLRTSLAPGPTGA